jgi:hypothetical protein
LSPGADFGWVLKGRLLKLRTEAQIIGAADPVKQFHQ